MNEDDAEARGKRAVELRQQIADLTKGGGRASVGDTAPRGEAAPPGGTDARDAQPPDRSGPPVEGPDSEGVGASEKATPSRGPAEAVRSNETSEEKGVGRRNAPSVHTPSPREFIARRMRELDRRRDDDQE